MRRAAITGLAVAALLLALPARALAAGPATAAAKAQQMPPAASWVLVDAGTGRVIAEHDEHLRLPPASLTKVLTAMIAEDWLPAGATVPVSALAANVYPDRVGMKAGQVWTLSEALHSLLIVSANDAAYALAQRVSGSLQAFAATMQDAAAQLGLSDDPVFKDPAGLDGSEGFDGGNLVSARDLAILGRDLLSSPQLARIVRTVHYAFTGPGGTAYSLTNFNSYFLTGYPGAIGIKTGFTDRAGFCVMEAATRSGRTMLAVVMHGANSYKTARMLLDKGFATPASAEPASDVLPPVRLPWPEPPNPFSLLRESLAGRSPPSATPPALIGTSLPGTSHSTVALAPSRPTGPDPLWQLPAAAVLAAGGAGALAALTRWRGRPSGHPAHSRRRRRRPGLS